MICEFTNGDLAVLLESLAYSIRAVRDAPDTPPAVRKENLDRLEELVTKLRSARESSRG
jgi:hypothetical protein